MTVFEYVPGRHYAVGSGEAIALCDGRAPLAAPRSLYEAFHGAHSVAAAMRSILALDLGEVASLAVIARGEGRWHVLVRGAGRVAVSLGDRVTVIEEPDVLTWSETTVAEADAFLLSFAADEGEKETLPAEGGVVAADRVLVPCRADGVVRPSAARPSAARPSAVRPAAPAAVAAAESAARSDPEAETAAIDLPQGAEDGIPVPAADSGAPGRDLQPVDAARIVLSNGRVVELDRPILLGRAPRASATPDVARPRLVTVPRASADVSRTHLLIAFDAGAVAITDTGSRNGTLVTRAGCEPVRLAPGSRMLVDSGTRLELGAGAHAVIEASR